MYSTISSLILWAPGPSELIIIAVIILLLFGGRKLPELMRGIGKGIREFNAAKANVRNEVEEGLRAEERKASEPKKMNDNENDSSNDSSEE
ncbi:MAG: Sec-independent protein translocase subunit TatA/TatB [Chitinophagales bacterium]